MWITALRSLHADGLNCFNRPTSIGLAGTLTADNTCLTFTVVDGQIVTFTGHSANAAFSKTDSKNVGYAACDRGRVARFNIPYIADQLKATSPVLNKEALTWQAKPFSMQRS
jgi:hypothetical protein